MDAATSTSPMPDAPTTAHVRLPTTKHTKIEAPHGGTINQIAVTPDGTGAVTIDDVGGMRLWPALDGSAEPRVIELPRPARFAIGPEPRGFVIAMIDEAGGAVIQIIDRDGAMVSRASLPLEPGYAGIAMTDRGTLAWRTDQRLVRLASDGAITAQLVTDPGQRVLGIGVAAATGIDKAVAVIEGVTDGKTWRRVRWLAIGDKLAWGTWITAAGDEIGGTIALSPSGKRFAYLAGVKPAFQIHVFDTVRNATVSNKESAPNASALEMSHDDTVAYSGMSGTQVIDLANKDRRILPSRAFGELAAGGGRIFTPNGGELAISTALATQYLGYGLQQVHVASPAPGGRMLIASGEFAAMLDAELRSSPAELVLAGQSITAARHVTGTEWLVASNRATGMVLSIVDVAKGTRAHLRAAPTTRPGLLVTYEPRSQLIGLSQNEMPELLQLAPDRLKARSVSAMAKQVPYERTQLWPVVPQQPGGAQVVVSQVREQLTLRWAPDPRALDKGPSITLDGATAAVDSTGRVYVWQRAKPDVLELVMYRDGKRLGVFPIGDALGPLWPENGGDRLLVTGNNKVVMFAPDGTRTWTRAFKGVGHALWLDDGTIAIVTGIGIARLDAKTGEPTQLRCGWAFGLTAKPHPLQMRTAPLCTQGR